MIGVREIITRDKGAFSLYIFACFFDLLASLAPSLVMSLLLGLLELGEQDYKGKVILALILTIVPLFLVKLAGKIKIGFKKDKMVNLRASLFDSVLKADYENFNKKSRDEYLSYLTNDITSVAITLFAFVNLR